MGKTKNHNPHSHSTRKTKILLSTLIPLGLLLAVGAGGIIGYLLKKDKQPIQPAGDKEISVNVSGSCRVENPTQKATITVTGYNGANLSSLTVPQAAGLNFDNGWSNLTSEHPFIQCWCNTATAGNITVNIVDGSLTKDCHVVVQAATPDQSISASVSGKLTDPSGATITVTLINDADWSNVTATSGGSNWGTKSTTSGTYFNKKLPAATQDETVTISLYGTTVACTLIVPSGYVPPSTIITINGSNTLTGTEYQGGQAQYNAIDNLGNDLTTSATWSITNLSGTAVGDVFFDASIKGLLKWKTVTTSCTFKINCAQNGLVSGQLDVTLTIGVIKNTLVADGKTYTINTSGNFMTTRSNSGAFQFTDYDGISQSIDRTKITEIHLHNLPTTDDTEDNYGRYLCYGMTNLTVADINIPSGIQSVGDNFCSYMFYGARKLHTLPTNFNLPSGISSVGNGFCGYMFRECVALTSLPDGFNLPSGIRNIGNSFCDYMFYSCSSLTTLPAGFNLPSGISSVGERFCYDMFCTCSKLTQLPAGFNLPSSGITSVSNNFCSLMFEGCSLLTSLPDGFNIPSGIQNVGDYFCDKMFENCSSLTTLPTGFNLPQGITNVGEYFCSAMFKNCGQLTAGSPPGAPLIIPTGISAQPNGFCGEMFSSSGITPPSLVPGAQIPIKRS